jgi:hypothetical protein
MSPTLKNLLELRAKYARLRKAAEAGERLLREAEDYVGEDSGADELLLVDVKAASAAIRAALAEEGK